METCQPGGAQKAKASKKDTADKTQNLIGRMTQRQTGRGEDEKEGKDNLDLIEDPNIKDSRLLREPEKEVTFEQDAMKFSGTDD